MFLLLDFQKYKTKKLIFFLTGIYGINLSLARRICVSLGYDQNIKINNLKSEDLNRINTLITVKHKLMIDSDLKKQKYDNIQIMKDIKCYKGVRHSYNLPVNGQRTHTNAKTRGWR